MRKFSKVIPQFWTGRTGAELRKAGPDALVVALHLVTSQHAVATGIYPIPLLYLAADLGMDPERARVALDSVVKTGFASYDLETETVFVHEMAKIQYGERLERGDKQVIGIHHALKRLAFNPFIEQFIAKYGAKFNLNLEAPSQGPSEAPYQAHSQGPTPDVDREQLEQLEQLEQVPPYPPSPGGEAEVKPDLQGLKPPKTDAAPYQAIMSLFNGTCPSLPKCTTISDTRKRLMKSAWKECARIAKETGTSDPFMILKSAFQKFEASDWHSGRIGGWKDGSIDWILKPANLVKFHERRDQAAGDPVKLQAEAKRCHADYGASECAVQLGKRDRLPKCGACSRLAGEAA